MPAEMIVLGLACVLLLAHIFLAGHFRTQQYGRDWNMGARDEQLPPLNPVAGRLARAKANYQETFPLVAALLIALVVVGKASSITATAAWVWLAARVVYVPLYWSGVPKVRTLVWAVALLAVLVLLGALLF
ncbi:MAG: hypothetical protein RLZZ08_307 [Pseudomonadota bacterium]|jgi:uncharacterized MAPEG superfamily protein